MLVDTPLKKDDIIAIRLIAGEEIIAKLIEVADQFLHVSKPLALVPSPQGGLAMQNYLMLGDMNHVQKINRDTIVVYSKANKHASDQYIKGTSSIATPNKPKLVV
mgnify:FL=1|jgi:hypothetical protein|tara:strand:+ start:206 stop:520 length:315 start_codon:yes stop_codon:yes gene_type:complete